MNHTTKKVNTCKKNEFSKKTVKIQLCGLVSLLRFIPTVSEPTKCILRPIDLTAKQKLSK